MSDLLRRLFTETWPAKAAKSAIEALMLPGQIAGGELATQPSAPGMWSDVDEARSQATQQGIGNRATDLAGLLMGGSYAAPAQRNAVGSGIRAYHGSPHDFDRFDLSKIGTGEGAQAYGHGLYFAESPKTAEFYRNVLAPRDGQSRIYRNGVEIGRVADDGTLTPYQHGNFQSVNALANADGNVQKASEYLQQQIAYYEKQNPSVAAKMKDALSDLSSAKYEWRNTPGRMYEVNINARPEQFLDWDKPLKQQPVADTMRGLVNPDLRKTFDFNVDRGVSGSNAYYNFYGSGKNGLAEASEKLREAGIPGIKYLDQGSRGAGEGSRNYVVFDDKLVDILRKYGLAGAAGPLGALLMGGGGDAQAQPTAP